MRCNANNRHSRCHNKTHQRTLFFSFTNRLFTTCIQLKKSFMNQIDAWHHTYGNTAIKNKEQFHQKISLTPYTRLFHGFVSVSRNNLPCRTWFGFVDIFNLVYFTFIFACTIIKCNLQTIKWCAIENMKQDKCTFGALFEINEFLGNPIDLEHGYKIRSLLLSI